MYPGEDVIFYKLEFHERIFLPSLPFVVLLLLSWQTPGYCVGSYVGEALVGGRFHGGRDVRYILRLGVGFRE